jgi:hypothetical protein
MTVNSSSSSPLKQQIVFAHLLFKEKQEEEDEQDQLDENEDNEKINSLRLSCEVSNKLNDL